MGDLFFYPYDSQPVNWGLSIMSRLKRIIMSQLPVDQQPTSMDKLFSVSSQDMEAFGEKIEKSDFLKSLLELNTEQALVFFRGRENSPVIATQHGFHRYGIE